MSIRRAAGAVCLALPFLAILVGGSMQAGWIAVLGTLIGVVVIFALLFAGIVLWESDR